MKKIKKITILLLISYVMIFIFGNRYSNAVKIEEEPTFLMIYREISNANGEVKNTFKYKLEPVEGNPASVDGVPEEITIEFNDEYKENVANATNIIDFTNADFPVKGIYKYMIKEVSSSNPDMYPVDEKNYYEIFIIVSNRDGHDVATMIGLGEHYENNVDQKEKMEIKFSSEMKQEAKNDEEKPTQDEQENNEEQEDNIAKQIIKRITPKTGDVISIYIAVFGLMVIVIIFAVIRKRKLNEEMEEEDLSEEEFLDDNKDDKTK